MKKNIAMVVPLLLAVMVVLMGCHKVEMESVENVPTPQPTPTEYVLTIEMVQDGACAIANAFVENKITVERTLENLAAINQEIDEALDNLVMKNWKKNKKTKNSNKNVGIAVAQKNEVNGLKALEGDIEDLCSFISDYYANDLEMSVIEKCIKNIKKTDYRLFNGQKCIGNE